MRKKKIIKKDISDIEIEKLLKVTEKEPLKLELLDFDLDSVPVLDYELSLVPEYDIDLTLLDYELPQIPDYELPLIDDYDIELTLLDYNVDLKQLEKENEKLEKELKKLL